MASSTALSAVTLPQLCSSKNWLISHSNMALVKCVKSGSGVRKDKRMKVSCMATSIPSDDSVPDMGKDKRMKVSGMTTSIPADDRVPEMGKRQLMNMLLLGAVSLPSVGMLIPNTYSGQEAIAAAPPVVKVVALAGELNKYSPNSGLIRAAVEISKSIKGLEMEAVDITPLPFLNTDLVVNGTPPPAVEAFRQKISAADGLFFGSPEYNYSVTGPLKNAIDWASFPSNVCDDKTAAIVSTGEEFGGVRSQYHLRQIGVRLNIQFINTPEFFLDVYRPPPKFDSEGNLTDDSTKKYLKEILLALYAFSVRLQGKSQ